MIIEKSPDPNMVWKVTTEPSIEPITLEELKLFARIDGDDENTLLSSFITSARKQIEDSLNRALIDQTITVKMDSWPETVDIELPRPPIISVTAVETIDELDVATVYASSNYFVDMVSEPARIVLRNGVTPPENTNRYYGGFQIRYRAGYGATAEDVPSLIREAIKQLATTYYENRAVGAEVPMEIQSLVNSFRVWYI